MNSGKRYNCQPICRSETMFENKNLDALYFVARKHSKKSYDIIECDVKPQKTCFIVTVASAEVKVQGQ